MVKVKDKWFRLIAITFIWLVAVYSNKLYSQSPSWTLAGRALLTLVSIALTWEGNRFIILHFREKFSGRYELIKRVAFVFIAGMLFTWLMLVCTIYVTSFILRGSFSGNGQVVRTLFNFPLFLQFALFFGIYEAGRRRR